MHKLDTLPNGLGIAVKPMEHMESVAIGIWIKAGGRYEDEKNNGISHLLEHLLFKGTKTRDMKKIKEEIEGRGGSFNGFTAEEFTCYLVKVLAKDAGLGIDILSDMVLNPRLDEEEVEKEKGVVAEEINMYKDMPAHHVHEILTEMLWPGEPLGLPLAGTAESVNSLTRKKIVSYKELYYNPKNMLIVSTGRIGEAEMLELAREHLGSPAGAGKDAPGFEKARDRRPKRTVRIDPKKTEQVHIAIGLHAMNRFHPDKHILSTLNILLGANMSSRLFHIVRDEMALCYEISSSARLYHDAGALVISAGVDERKLKKCLEVILRELGRLKKESVSAEELKRAKEYYKGQLLFALEDTMSYMLWLGEKMTTGEREFSVKKILDRIDSVTRDDIRRVSGDIFKEDNLNLAVIGPVKDKKGPGEVLHLE
ncbi:MAG: pitrilysin family protein [Candidatus Omnitrophota bacterium]